MLQSAPYFELICGGTGGVCGRDLTPVIDTVFGRTSGGGC